MSMFELQNVLYRTFEVQALMQQTISQSEIAQKLAAQRLERERKDQETQIQQLEKTEKSEALWFPPREESQKESKKRRRYQLKNAGGKFLPEFVNETSIQSHHIDLNV